MKRRFLPGAFLSIIILGIGIPKRALAATPEPTISASASAPVAASQLASPAAPANSVPGKPEATPSTIASPTPAAKRRALPFKSNIISVDKKAATFRMGKKKIRLVHVTPETKLLTGDGKPATFDTLLVGAEVRGSLRKRDNGELEAASIKIGPKANPPAPVSETEGDPVP